MRTMILASLLLSASAVAQEPVEPPVEQRIANALPAVKVFAKRETEPVGTADDAADDPAIWRNPANPSDSLVVATDKRAGLHVYDMAGRRLDFAPSPRLNNVDLRADVIVDGKPSVLVAASDRQDEASAKVALFVLDTDARKLLPLASIAAGPGEAYGMCLWQRKSDYALYAFMVLKDGRIDQIALDMAGPKPSGRIVRTMKLGTQSEGCVVDDRTGKLYVAEEDVGLWRFNASPSASVKPKKLAAADGRHLVMDAEGLAIAPIGRTGGFLVASSQGDNSYVLYRLSDAKFVGRFRIDQGDIDGTSETDGLDLAVGNFGSAFPEGLLVVQDGDNAPLTQNFKYVAWGDVIKALKLK